jgi:hypothetical protein
MLKRLIGFGILALAPSAVSASVTLSITAGSSTSPFSPLGWFGELHTIQVKLNDADIGHTVAFTSGTQTGSIYLDDDSFLITLSQNTQFDDSWSFEATFDPIADLSSGPYWLRAITPLTSHIEEYHYGEGNFDGSVTHMKFSRTDSSVPGASVQTTYDYVSRVPEPASWALMLGGFGMVGGAMRSRRKAAVSFG